MAAYLLEVDETDPQFTDAVKEAFESITTDQDFLRKLFLREVSYRQLEDKIQNHITGLSNQEYRVILRQFWKLINKLSEFS